MFKWPDPPKGQYYIKAPFIIYFCVSALLAVITGLFMKYYSDERVDQAWKQLKSKFPAKTDPGQQGQGQEGSFANKIWIKIRRRKKPPQQVV